MFKSWAHDWVIVKKLVCTKVNGKLIWQTAVIATTTATATTSGQKFTFVAEVWADNWFAMYIGDKLVLEDSVSITTERSFNAESFGFNDNAAKFRNGTIGLKETTAEAFAGFARGLSVPGKPMEGFAKIKRLIDETINWLLTGGKYKTWDDVFEKAQLGDIKDRGPVGGVDDGVQYAADPPDPAEFARRIDQNMQALEV